MKVFILDNYDPETDSMGDGSYIPNTPIIFSESNSIEGYSDQTSLQFLDRYYKNYSSYQYVQIRKFILNLVLALLSPDYSTWNSLSLEEKKIASKYGCAPYALRIGVVSDEVDSENFRILLEETAGYHKINLFGRRRIVEEMRQYIGLNQFRKEVISKVDIDDIYQSTSDILESYIASNNPAFKYWVNNTIGTPYETDGFSQKSYYDSTIKAKLNDIMSGNY